MSSSSQNNSITPNSNLEQSLAIYNQFVSLVLEGQKSATQSPKNNSQQLTFSPEDLHLFCKYGQNLEFLRTLLKLRLAEKITPKNSAEAQSSQIQTGQTQSTQIQNTKKNNQLTNILSHYLSSQDGFQKDWQAALDALENSLNCHENWLNDQIDSNKTENRSENTPQNSLQNLSQSSDSTSDKYLQTIVSAAPNVSHNMLTAVARIGTKLPFFGVSERKLRGKMSYGLCLGKSEIGMETEYSSGLVDIPSEILSFGDGGYISTGEMNLISDFLGILDLDAETNYVLETVISLIQKSGSRSYQNKSEEIGEEEVEENLEDAGIKNQADEEKSKNDQQQLDKTLNSFLKTLSKSATKVYLQNLASSNPEKLLGFSVCTIFPDFFAEDTVFDIKVLPDRVSQIGNHLGMALEIARGIGSYQKLTPLASELIAETKSSDTDNFYDFSPDLESLIKDLQKGFGDSQAKLKDTESEIGGADINSLEIELEDQTGIANVFTLTPLKIKKPYTLNCQNQLKMMLLEKNLTCGIADLSNYLLVDIGQPSHFFDLKKVLD